MAPCNSIISALKGCLSIVKKAKKGLLNLGNVVIGPFSSKERR